jgi:hypothetical protein
VSILRAGPGPRNPVRESSLLEKNPFSGISIPSQNNIFIPSHENSTNLRRKVIVNNYSILSIWKLFTYGGIPCLSDMYIIFFSE